MKSARSQIIDALLVHTYWYDLKNHGEIDICNRIQVLATLEIWKKYKIKNIVIVGGSLFRGRVPIANEIVQLLRKDLPKSFHKSVLIFPTERTTLGEIKKFQQIAYENNWYRLGSVGIGIHLPRIKKGFESLFRAKNTGIHAEDELSSLTRLATFDVANLARKRQPFPSGRGNLFKNTKIEVFFFNADEVLRGKSTSILSEYKNSEQLRLLVTNELIANKLVNIPFLGHLIMDTLGKFVVHKGHLQPKIVSFVKKTGLVKSG